MLKALSSSACGLNAQQLRVDTLANNLSNIDTPGYKKLRTNFAQLINQSVVYTGSPGNPEVTSGNGVRVAQVAKYFSPGDVVKTGRSLDLAINGEGFFRVVRGNEEYYTRDGTFNLDESGNLVNPNGCVLEGIRFSPDTDRIMISADGTVEAEGPEGISASGQIQLYKFTNLAGLKLEGGDLLSFDDTAGTVAPGIAASPGYGTIIQGFLEMPNFSLVEEMANLIEAQRAYGFNARTMRTADEMWSMANNLRK
ncbi:flagellar hook-basal body complex protein [Pelotomaculum terephthalicicum JT]|uniref:flagellar hook-basal body protein n=1 Tax=Pelotomaculum TaxID=191373 RepID=UPI0009D1D2A9|nr:MULTISPECIES: flagellar hook-basal body complex protein [Pelotomaculum]MCG9967960.1 flagellar hook-basal body complex protein [Pelotomaculum terephthalicicum JT]OPX88560.1 MAG: Flagellar basal-body rod protein FlgG [Pelotomaculum sp. PtaB.Bin117]OPY63067.1 MAG: Flagellar basal-body rod protein FlgG [Pelotomaculum sp. PtaU1.Bin065]